MDDWQPEFTPKTGRPTKKSRDERDRIRRQRIYEQAVDDFDTYQIIELAGFVGGTIAIKNGNDIMFGLMGNLFGDAVDTLSKAVKEVFEEDFSVWDLFNLRTGVPTEMQIRKLKTTLDEQQVKFLKGEFFGSGSSSEKEVDSELTTAKKGLAILEASRAGFVSQIEAEFVRQNELQARLPDATPQERVIIKAILDAQDILIRNLQDVIDALDVKIETQRGIISTLESVRQEIISQQNVISEPQWQKFLIKIEAAEWALAIAEMSIIRWFLRSYEVAEAIENATITG